MGVFRSHPSKNFTTLSNKILQDKELSHKARGLACYMLSLPPDWSFSVNGLVVGSKESAKAIRSALKELEECGYLRRTKYHDAGGRIDYMYDIFDDAEVAQNAAIEPIAPHDQKGHTAKGHAVKGHAVEGHAEKDTLQRTKEKRIKSLKNNYKEINTHSESAHYSLSEMEKQFETIWAQYPKKEGKAQARHAYIKAVTGQSGSAYTPEEILVETILYRHHIEKQLESGETSYRYIPSGAKWFEREGWTDDYPSIAKTFEDLSDSIAYSRGASKMRTIAEKIATADEGSRQALSAELDSVIQSLPYQ